MAMATTAGQRFKVAVIGGGLAGLAAASTLAKHYGADAVVVLEAASSLGGRVKHVTGIAPWPVEVLLASSINKLSLHALCLMGRSKENFHCHNTSLDWFWDVYEFWSRGALVVGFHLQKKAAETHLPRSGDFCMESNFLQLQSVKMLGGNIARWNIHCWRGLFRVILVCN